LKLNDASRRKFDVVMAWPIDRVGRSLIDLLDTIQHLAAVGVDLYLISSRSTPPRRPGKLLFQLTGAFAEFERSTAAGPGWLEGHRGEARARWQARLQGLQGAQEAWPAGAEPDKIDRTRRELAKGIGIGKVAKTAGLGVGTVHRLKRENASHTAD
jgi:DNA invertase Pin-like site-specific DNA recombinase